MKTLKEKIEVMQAALYGKEVQFFNSSGEWQDLEDEEPLWDWDQFDYRIKPTPLEFWVNVHANLTHAVEVFTTEGDAEIHAKHSKVKTIKVREVME